MKITDNEFWIFPMPGFFIDWATRRQESRYPRAIIRAVSSKGPLCGFVPHDWDGKVVQFEADETKRGWDLVE